MSWKKTMTWLVAAFFAAFAAAADWSAGVSAFNAGDLGAAEVEFRALTESQPEWHGGHLMLGQTLLRDGRTAEALTSLERARALDPGDFLTAFALGQAHLKLDRFAEAAGVLGGLDPGIVPESQKLAFYKARAIAFAGSGDAGRALTAHRAAVELAPDDAGLHRQIAEQAKAAERADLAITHFGRATEIDPGDSESMGSLVELLYNRAIGGDSARQAAVCETVLPHARRLVDLDGSHQHLVLMARVATCVGLHEAARDTLNAAVAARPEDWSARVALGKAHVQLKEWAEARAAFEDALLKKVPDEEKAGVQSRLGYAFEQLGKLDDALARYRLAGDAVGIARVEQNILAKEEEDRLAALAAEKARIEQELAALGKGSGI